jgi:hypothetical protein
MNYGNMKEHLDEATLSSVWKEMAKPRLAASVRKSIGKTFMATHAKFRIGVLLQNRNTKEDGLVTRVYQLAECGVTMYEVAVPVPPDTWAGGHYVSDWAESTLKLSDNAILMRCDKSLFRPIRTPRVEPDRVKP